MKPFAPILAEDSIANIKSDEVLQAATVQNNRKH